MPRGSSDESEADTGTFAEGLGRAIRVLRTGQDMSRKELAARAELSYSYLAEIEKGIKSPSSEALVAIARGLGMPTHELVAAADTWRTARTAKPGLREHLRALVPGSARSQARASEPPDRGFHEAPTRARSGRERLSQLVARQPEAELLSMPHLSLSTDFLPERAESAMAPMARLGGEAEIPRALIEQIDAGRCVALVGAGFSAAADLPGWGALLTRVALHGAVDPETREHVAARIRKGSASALDEAAQVLEDELGREHLVAQLREMLDRPEISPPMAQRLHWLHGIPFRAILTTNFDALLRGQTPSHETYREALRPDAYRWWEPRYWGGEGAFTLKLHGDLAQHAAARDSLVLTRRDYRRRLYDDPAYTTFLRAVMATSTVLYLGFSFEDAYLNELRSEILALLGQEQQSAPVAYAVVNDVPADTVRHFRRHEGIEILSYDSRGGSDFSGFDHILQALYEATSPLLRFARHLAHKRILWIDPHPQNNEPAFAHLADAARISNRPTSLVTADSAEAGLREIAGAEPGARYDLAITHWGEGAALDDAGRPMPTAVRLLQGLRQQDLRCPVVVFAARGNADRRKRIALGLGAQAYCFTFERLYQTIERILAPADETG